jgi:Uma2 family endonuclease
MASKLALDPAHRRITVEEFLGMDFGDTKVELVDGIVYMMAGGKGLHNAISMNVALALGNKLKGSGCRPYGSDQGVKTTHNTVRYPDVSVYCGRAISTAFDDEVFLGDPKIVVEVLSQSTIQHDQRDKLDDYRELTGVECILFIAPDSKRVRQVTRTGPQSWNDAWLTEGHDVIMEALGITLTHAEIFSRD